ncbi:DUF4397 domain-containing protein [Chitinophaga varians]|uniref:DUF4397 domain-containing protein n=1 Tax=Chitinophaga varians TaxID=2202339 RepID=A0A847RR10_9BACT|nr:DUF4397 domain-containing protein [Chitinophaga varians]NLR63328.1 DUF4397 domain-containing protein [Chitinophaga varians]
MKHVRTQSGISLTGISCALLVAATFMSCKKNNDSAPQPSAKKSAGIQIVHTAPKVGDLTVEIDGKKLPEKLPFLNPSKGYITVAFQNESSLKVTQDGNKVIVDTKFRFNDKGAYSLFLYDTLNTNKVRAVLLNDNLADPGKGKTSLRFLHLSPNTAAVDIDVFKGSDSIRLVNNAAYISDKPDVAVLSPFKAIASGDYRVKVKTKAGTTITTVLDIPSVKLVEGKVVTLYLSGLTKASGALGVGLQLWQHR